MTASSPTRPPPWGGYSRYRQPARPALPKNEVRRISDPLGGGAAFGQAVFDAQGDELAEFLRALGLAKAFALVMMASNSPLKSPSNGRMFSSSRQ